jgi:hypothetical protein
VYESGLFFPTQRTNVRYEGMNFTQPHYRPAKLMPDQVRALLLEPRWARFSICRITAEKSCSGPSSDCLALISKAAPAAGIRAPTAFARSKINPKSPRAFEAANPQHYAATGPQPAEQIRMRKERFFLGSGGTEFKYQRPNSLLNELSNLPSAPIFSQFSNLPKFIST